VRSVAACMAAITAGVCLVVFLAFLWSLPFDLADTGGWPGVDVGGMLLFGLATVGLFCVAREVKK
jgi:hypothetical protein